MNECLFCKIAKGEAPCHKIWENEDFLAFLSIFPNTEGSSIVIPKRHYSSYAFDLPHDVLCHLILAAKEVSLLLDARLEGVGRCGLVLEGFGVDHVHAKIFPMRGLPKLNKWQPLQSCQNKYFEKYEGYISSHDYFRANDKALEKLAEKIRG